MYICFMKTGIYRITNIVNYKVYIGSAALDYKSRFRQHRHLLKHNKHFNNHLQSAYNKYGEENFEFDLIEACGIDIIYERENYYISLYDSTNIKLGYNKGLAIIGTLGYKMTDESKKRMSVAKKGTIMHINTKLALINANKNRTYAKGYTQSEETIKKCADSHKKPILQYDLEGNFIQEFDSATTAAITLNSKSASQISACIRGERNKASGFMWRKRESGEIQLNIDPIKIKSLKKEIYQYDLEFNFIKKFESIVELAKHLNMSATYIKMNIIYSEFPHQGYIYKYLNNERAYSNVCIEWDELLENQEVDNQQPS